MAVLNKKVRIDRLFRAMDAAPYGSDRRRAIKMALMRLLYSPQNRSFEVTPVVVGIDPASGGESFVVHGTVTGRITAHRPNIEEI